MQIATLILMTLSNLPVSVSASFSCPTWTYPNLSSSQHECVCGDPVGGAVSCDQNTKEVSIAPYYCMTYDSKENMMVVGYCPYRNSETWTHTLPNDSVQATHKLCSRCHRKGHLCGECEDNYTLSLYSYDLGCVQCGDGLWYNWFTYIAVAFLPLTLFYIIMLIFSISVTSPLLNGFVLISQLAATPTF